MKKLLLSLLVLSQTAFADSLTDDFRDLVIARKITPLSEQAYCYNQNGVQGHQVDKLQKIASVTKLLTTYFAVETQDLNSRFTTKLYIDGDKLHIEGGRDPYWEEEKMLLLMMALNQQGYRSFKTVTFDRNFLFSDAALSEFRVLTSEHTRSRLQYYLNSANAKMIRNTWLTVAKFAKEEGVTLDTSATPALTVGTVKLVDTNPLANLNPVVLVHRSRPLHALLKAMNVMSKNIVSENIFNESSRSISFDALMERAGISKASYVIRNGSGLPIKTASTRFDNLASCRTILQLISQLEESAKRQGFALSDIVAVNGGKDLGTFRKRFLKQPETHEAVISKTGTLAVASTLAGVLMINGSVPFAILNNTVNAASARQLQDEFVSRMFHHLGEPTPLDYTKISIFPWDGEAFLESSY